jgi:acyl-CoA thioesterase-1
MLIGMRMPTNYGPAYADQFHALYGELAKKFAAPLVDFFLDGVALDPALMQSDGIHPNTQAQPRLLNNLWPTLSPMLHK